MWYKLAIVVLFLSVLSSLRAFSQELDCQISVTSQQVEGTDKRAFEALQQALYEFVNNRKWSSYDFRIEEKIEGTIMITVNERISSDEYKATLNLVLRRPVFNTSYNSPLLNLVDKDFTFKYVESQPLDFSDNTFTSNLTSVIAFYVYMFIAVDMDSFTPYGGTPFYEKAQGIVNAAQNAQEVGWKGFESQKNRFWLVENFTNSSNAAIREFYYKYHRQGLDLMYDKVDQGRTAITESMNYLQTLYNAKPGLYGLQLIFDAKRDEFVNIYSDQKVPPMEKTQVVNILKEIDPANGSKYQTILSGK
ncbi:MAG: DUF4835 family protein [Syntrophothermus sp.]